MATSLPPALPHNNGIPEDIICPVCMEKYGLDVSQNPVMLPGCGHTICRNCLTSICNDNQSGGDCPICRVPYTGLHPKTLPANFLVLSMMQAHLDGRKESLDYQKMHLERSREDSYSWETPLDGNKDRSNSQQMHLGSGYDSSDHQTTHYNGSIDESENQNKIHQISGDRNDKRNSCHGKFLPRVFISNSREAANSKYVTKSRNSQHKKALNSSRGTVQPCVPIVPVYNLNNSQGCRWYMKSTVGGDGVTVGYLPDMCDPETNKHNCLPKLQNINSPIKASALTLVTGVCILVLIIVLGLQINSGNKEMHL